MLTAKHNKKNLPRHIAIIMDGNGRWARRRMLPRTEGHRRGFTAAQKLIDSALEIGISVVSLFAFSSENWNRPKNEVQMLMHSLERFLVDELGKLQERKVRFFFSGDMSKLPLTLQAKIINAIESTKDNTALILNLCLNYSGRMDIVNAARKIAEDVVSRKIEIETIDEDLFSKYLYTAGLPDPDLLIRTSGEIRISNFLLWQLSYTELYFPKVYWPDFGKADLLKAIEEYQSRDRRFGRVK